MDGGGLVVLEPDEVTLVTGGFIADGPRLEETLATAVEALRAENPAFVEQGIDMDAGRQAGVRFHTVSMPIPPDAENREALVQMVGEHLDMVIGVGPQSVYVGVGKGPLEVVRRVIDRSEEGRSATVPPMRISLALGTLSRFIAEVGDQADQAKAEAVAALLESAAGRDHVYRATA